YTCLSMGADTTHLETFHTMLQSLTGFPPPVRCWFTHIVHSDDVCLRLRSVAIYRRTFKSPASTDFAIRAVALCEGRTIYSPPRPRKACKNTLTRMKKAS